MFEINGVGIKSPEDLQEGLLKVRHTEDQFIFYVQGMIDKWGLESTLKSLHQALYGVENYFPGLLHFTHEVVDDFERTGDPNAWGIFPIKRDSPSQP